MNKQEYNNVIETTLAQQTGEKDSLQTTRQVLNNMGVVLPQGDLQQVSEGLATDDYMGWRKCSLKEAQEYANEGTAVVAASDDQIAVVAANDDDGEGEVAANSSAVMTLDENTSALAVADMVFYANSRAGTTGIRRAIIIVPGVMGTELELAEGVGKFAAGTLVWPPYVAGQSVDNTAVNKLIMLQCNSDGSSTYNLRVRNTNNYGALQTYKTLYTTLHGKFNSSHDVVFFAYDWRKSNATNGSLLKAKVNEYDKVIIVAHSMGGLVASHMLKDNNIRKKVDMLITVGTPFLGSLEMLPVFSHGEMEAVDSALASLSNPVLRWVAKEFVLQPILKDIAQNIPSLYELLPTKKFFSLDNRWYYSIKYLFGGDTPLTSFDLTRSYLGVALDYININLFDLATTRNESLWEGNAHVTDSVNSFYIVGEGKETANKYTYTQVGGSYTMNTTTSGDGTVLSYSASLNDLYPDSTYFATGAHTEMVTNPNIKVIKFIEDLIGGHIVQSSNVSALPSYSI